MRIDEKIEKYLVNEKVKRYNEKELWGFKNKRELALEIEEMDVDVVDRDRKKFDAILNPVLKNRS